MPKGNEALNIAIGERIAKCRQDAALTQQALADLTGLSLQFIACVERGKKGVGIDTVIRIAEALHVSIDYLVLGNSHEADAHYFEEILSRLSEPQIRNAKKIMEALTDILSREEAHAAARPAKKHIPGEK